MHAAVHEALDQLVLLGLQVVAAPLAGLRGALLQQLPGVLVQAFPNPAVGHKQVVLIAVNNQNIALSREQILDAVWGMDYFGDTRTVDTHIKCIRSKLGDFGKRIQTIRKFGYKLEL